MAASQAASDEGDEEEPSFTKANNKRRKSSEDERGIFESVMWSGCVGAVQKELNRSVVHVAAGECVLREHTGQVLLIDPLSLTSPSKGPAGQNARTQQAVSGQSRRWNNTNAVV